MLQCAEFSRFLVMQAACADFGEPGLMKDTIASLIHFGSPVRREAMVRLDCARPDGGLAELFGRGQKKGLLHWLQEGTLLLTNWHQVRLRSRLPLACWMQTSAAHLLNPMVLLKGTSHMDALAAGGHLSPHTLDPGRASLTTALGLLDVYRRSICHFAHQCIFHQDAGRHRHVKS